MRLELIRPRKINGKLYGRGEVIDAIGKLCEELLRRHDAVPADGWVPLNHSPRKAWITGWRER